GHLEIEVRGKYEPNTVLDIKRFGIDRNLAFTADCKIHLNVPCGNLSAGRSARSKRGVANHRNIAEDCAFFDRMQLICPIQAGQNVMEDEVAIYRARFGIPVVVNPHIYIGVRWANRRRVQTIFPGGWLLLTATATTALRLLRITGCSGKAT